jgi:hydrogenase maturation protein HypF
VHQLASANSLAGFVLNSTLGVTIEIEGPEEAQQRFLAAFRSAPPPLAAIDHVQEDLLEHVGYIGFEIRDSQAAASEFVLVPPDIATCDACLADFRNPADRRFGYPFTNCTHCGPRYTIIQDIPYDRRFTTMSEFQMCAECEAEYHDPANRRFHAQPNACPVCGPWVELWDHSHRLAERAETFRETRKLLEAGRILAIKGLGGFHLACLATSDDAVRLLRDRKRRSDKPFAIMTRDTDAAEKLCHLPPSDRAALLSMRRPIVLLERRDAGGVSSYVAPGLSQVGVMLPYTPLHHLLFDDASYDALVMTSGNLSEEPIASRNEDVAGRLEPLADYFLIHNRKIQIRVDDSVVRTFEGRERTLRRSRGYAPHPVDLARGVHQILACGGELKNVFCLTKDHYAVLSQHVGDLENLETMQAFQETLDHMKRFFRVEPQAVAYDLHPRYLSTRYALGLSIEKIGVQHHHAHIASSMAENHLDGRVIGIALDGTGYGTDGKIWGGEFLACDYANFERLYHFRYVPLAGGDAAVREPWRSALAYAIDSGVEANFPGISLNSVRIVEKMIAGSVNTVDTSSCGRLFDAVSALLGIRLIANYEGQAAMMLEASAADLDEPYPFDFSKNEIDFRETIRALVKDREQRHLAAGRFHVTLAHVVVEAALRIRSAEGLNRVCLSGGSWQNFRLLGKSVKLLRAKGFEVYLHSLVPPNDGGLSLGQAAIANRLLDSR